MRRLKWIPCALVLLLTLSACDSADDDEEPDVGPSNFEVEVSGDVNESLDGFAYFGTGEDPETGDEAFVIALSNSEDVNTTGTWAVIGRQADRPSTGTYSFADLDAEGDNYPANEFGMFLVLSQGQMIFASDSGELTITESGSNEVTGTFSIEATGFEITQEGQEELDVTITGEFNATQPDDFVMPGSF